MSIEDFNYSEVVGEDLPEGQNSVQAQEKAQEKAREKAAEQARKMAAAQKAGAFFKKQEKKSKSYDQALVNFLVVCLSSGLLSEDLLNALLGAIRVNHSPQILLVGLSLIYKVDFDQIHSSVVTNTNAITYYQVVEVQEISLWLSKLEEASHQSPNKTLQAILSNPDLLARFFEIVVHNYKTMYSKEDLPADLVNLSKNIVVQLQNMLEKYILENSIE